MCRVCGCGDHFQPRTVSLETVMQEVRSLLAQRPALSEVRA